MRRSDNRRRPRKDWPRLRKSVPRAGLRDEPRLGGVSAQEPGTYRDAQITGGSRLEAQHYGSLTAFAPRSELLPNTSSHLQIRSIARFGTPLEKERVLAAADACNARLRARDRRHATGATMIPPSHRRARKHALSRRIFLKRSAAAASTLILTEAAQFAFSGGVHVAQAAGPEVTKALLGFIALTDAAPLFVAKERGIFAKYG